MSKKDVPKGVYEDDELLHSPTDDLKWRESYYFNWVDLNNRVSGFSTIGFVPHEKKQELVFFLFMEDFNEIYYREPPLLDFTNDIDKMLRDKRLSYKLIEPFKNWEIAYKSRKCDFLIQFKTRFPTYNFGKDSSASWHQHFEASGIFKGYLKYSNDSILKLNGYGQRDKSWGTRDWHLFNKWFAGHFQFKNWSCAFRKDYINNHVDLSGYISNNEGIFSLNNLKIKTTYDNDKFNSPLSAIYSFTDSNNNNYQIKSKRIKNDSFIRFNRNFQGGYTELFEQMVIMKDLRTEEIGSGMMEHLRTSK
jgi:hypothetical protein